MQVTDEMVEAACREINRRTTWVMHPRTVRPALEAALAQGNGAVGVKACEGRDDPEEHPRRSGNSKLVYNKATRTIDTVYTHPAPSPAQAGAEPDAWRCFHCDEAFTDPAEARLHFGDSEACDPICQVTAERYREVERQLEAYRTETDATSVEFYRLGAEHYRKERGAEQTGYDRGLADAKAYPETLGLTFASPPASEPTDQQVDAALHAWHGTPVKDDDERPAMRNALKAGGA